MKRVLCLVIAMMLAVTMACSVFAAETASDDNFVPSISYKDHPDIVPYKNADGEEVLGEVIVDGDTVSHFDDECILVTSIYEALNDSDVPDDVKEELLKVYYALLDDTMEIPYDKINKRFKPEYMTVRDLFDVRWLCDEHEEMDDMADRHISMTFHLGVTNDANVYAMVYNGEEWVPAISVVNNGDGTVTCVFEDVGIVAFSVIDEANMPLWMTSMWDYIRKVVTYLI